MSSLLFHQPYLPQEIISDILLRLPVKSLCRFKIVSKTWSCLISSPYFVKSHLQISSQKIKKEGNHKFISLFRVDNPRLCSVVELIVLEDMKTAEKLKLDISNLFPYCSNIVGSYNGLCCVNMYDDIVLWNPSTRQTKCVPKLPHHCDFHFGNFGFAYDEFTDDYRVIELRSKRFDSGIIDYSLRRDSWNTSHERDIDGQVVSNSCPFVGGNLHWLLEKYDKSLIALSYNLKTGSLGEITLPPNNEGVGNGFEPITLGVLSGCLCMVLWLDFYIVIWTMKDYGIHGSWSKVASYSGEQRLSWNRLIWPSAGDEDDHIVLSSSNRLGLFGAKDGIMKEHHCLGFTEARDITFAHHVESLVSPTSYLLNNK